VDNLARSRRLVLTVGLAACAPGAAIEPVGASPPRRPEPVARVADAGTSRASPVPADFRQRLLRVSERFLSRGHGERFDATVWANPQALAPPDAGDGAPDGAMYLEEATTRDARGDRSAGVLVMEKKGGSWQFGAVGPKGEIADDAGVGACVTCHREADDGVFPWAKGS
jgi:hypothetical protein